MAACLKGRVGARIEEVGVDSPVERQLSDAPGLVELEGLLRVALLPAGVDQKPVVLRL